MLHYILEIYARFNSKLKLQCMYVHRKDNIKKKKNVYVTMLYL